MTDGTPAVDDTGWDDPRWHDASRAAVLFAVDPAGTGVARIVDDDELARRRR
ncbi:MAG: hypothetical protein H7Z10_07535, partial [Gemmatimonadaceae bacterium]|nr:hypothetical protein [Acetobacteraceae bacterium]